MSDSSMSDGSEACAGSFVEKAAALKFRAGALRGSCAELRSAVAHRLAQGFAEQAMLVAHALSRVPVPIAAATSNEIDTSLSSLRRDHAALRQDAVELRASVLTMGVEVRRGLRQHGLLGMVSEEDNAIERAAVRDLHRSIATLIQETDASGDLERDHQHTNFDQLDAAVKATERPGGSERTRRLFLNHPASTAAAVAEASSTVMPPPADVHAAMFGPRSWSGHVPSLLDAIPYATNALSALRQVLARGRAARDLLHIRIHRQEADLSEMRRYASTVEAAARDHIHVMHSVLAQAESLGVGALGAYVLPSTLGGRPLPEQLGLVATSVERVLGELGRRVLQHRASNRPVVAPVLPPSPAGAVPVVESTTSPIAAKKERLFPTANRVGELQGVVAILRHRIVQMRFQRALLVLRFRRCASSLAAAAAIKRGHEGRGGGGQERRIETENEGRVSSSRESSCVGSPKQLSPANPFTPISPEMAKRRLQHGGLLPATGEAAGSTNRADQEDSATPRGADSPTILAFRPTLPPRARDVQQVWRDRREREREVPKGQSALAPPSPRAPRPAAPATGRTGAASRSLLQLQGGHASARSAVIAALPQPVLPPHSQAPTLRSAAMQRLRPLAKKSNRRREQQGVADRRPVGAPPGDAMDTLEGIPRSKLNDVRANEVLAYLFRDPSSI